jgi:hypothetical protein
LKGIEAFRQRQVFLTVNRLAGDQALAKEFAVEASAPPGAIDVMAMCTEELACKYELMSGWSPEVMLTAAAAIWIGKDLALMKRLGELHAVKNREDGRAAAEEVRQRTAHLNPNPPQI